MDAVSKYSLASLAWLSAQAVPLIIWPSLVSTLLRADSPQQPGIQYSPANAALEQYFARSLGLSQLALGSLLLVLSGVLPLDSAVEAPEDVAAGATPIANAAVLISALYHAAAASYSYMRYYATGQLAYLLGCLCASVLATFGLWVLMFAGNRRLSRRTGADKETSGWPFKNVEAEKKKKKRF